MKKNIIGVLEINNQLLLFLFNYYYYYYYFYLRSIYASVNKNFWNTCLVSLKNKFGKKKYFFDEFNVKRSKKRFFGSNTKKNFLIFSFWLAAFFYPFYIKNEKNRFFISAWFLGEVPLKLFK